MARMRLWGVRNTFCTAMGGLDMALWDAYARGRNEPLYATLGAQPRAHKPYYSVGLYDEKTVIEVAEEAIAENYPGLKIKAGFPTLEEDLAAVRAAKRVLGNRALMIDYNQSLTVAGTLIVICYALPIFISVVVPILILYYLLQKFYVATARQVIKNRFLTFSMFSKE